jgi:hypothetical protein
VFHAFANLATRPRPRFVPEIVPVDVLAAVDNVGEIESQADRRVDRVKQFSPGDTATFNGRLWAADAHFIGVRPDASANWHLVDEVRR